MSYPAYTTREAFAHTLAAAKPGDKIIYHVGSLMEDRQYGQHFLAVHGVALAAWAAMEAGTVALLQGRIGGTTEYLARVLPKPHKPVTWEGCYSLDRFQLKQRGPA